MKTSTPLPASDTPLANAAEPAAGEVSAADALPKSFEPAPIEAHWYPLWESRGYFANRAAGDSPAVPTTTAGNPSYSIQLPPPNVTGTLHMGHAFQQTLMDTLIRYNRMRGADTNWIVGTDHAGIATQIVVERQLQRRARLVTRSVARASWRASGTGSRNRAPPSPARCGAWAIPPTGRTPIPKDRAPATSPWTRRCRARWWRCSCSSTRPDSSIAASGWSTGIRCCARQCRTWKSTWSSATVTCGTSSIRSRTARRSTGTATPCRGMTIATTRPETMLGDGALAVHPDDPRYRHLVGKYVDLPLCDRKIPIIADTFVDPEFGSGCVKITGAHDFNDYAAAQRHGIPLIVIMDFDANMNDEVPAPYRGLNRYVARDKVVADLQADGLLMKTIDHKHMVPICGRTNEVVEPMLTDQWFVDLTRTLQPDGRIGGHAAITVPALEAVSSGSVRSTPNTGRAPTTTGSKASRTGASRGSCGGATRSPPGTAATANCSSPPPRRTPWTRRARPATPAPLSARPGRARHLVLLGAGAFHLARLAGQDAAVRRRPGALPALVGADHRQRHHLLLGRPDGDDDPVLHRQGAVPPRLHQRHRARCRRPEDVQVQGQHPRPPGPDRRHHHRRAARQVDGRPDEVRPQRTHPEVRPQDLSRRASRPSAPTRCASPSPRWPRSRAR